MTERASQGPASAERLVAGTGAAHLDDPQAARIELRNTVQWLARVAHSFGPAASGEVRLRFDERARRIDTPDLGRETRLSLQLPALVFQFYEHGAATPHALDVDDRSSTEVEAWLLAELLHRGFDQSLLRKELPYAPDGLMSGDATKYGSHSLSDRLRGLTQDMVEAAVIMRKAREVAAGGARVTPSDDLLFWPDRCAFGFALPCGDGDIEVSYEADDGNTGRFRLSKRRAGPTTDILIASAPDTESVARDIVSAIGSLGAA